MKMKQIYIYIYIYELEFYELTSNSPFIHLIKKIILIELTIIFEYKFEDSVESKTLFYFESYR